MGKTYIVLLIAVVVLFCVLVATIIAARFLKRVFEITENYAKGDFSDKMSQKSFGFFQKISNNLNEIASNYQNIESERDTFISHVSHELKTPLMSISGFADGMLDKTIPENEYSKYIKIVSGEAHRLSRLVNSMVNLSKLESGKKPLDKTNINLIELTLNCLLTFEKQIDP